MNNQKAEDKKFSEMNEMKLLVESMLKQSKVYIILLSRGAPLKLPSSRSYAEEHIFIDVTCTGIYNNFILVSLKYLAFNANFLFVTLPYN